MRNDPKTAGVYGEAAGRAFIGSQGSLRTGKGKRRRKCKKSWGIEFHFDPGPPGDRKEAEVRRKN